LCNFAFGLGSLAASVNELGPHRCARARRGPRRGVDLNDSTCGPLEALTDSDADQRDRVLGQYRVRHTGRADHPAMTNHPSPFRRRYDPVIQKLSIPASTSALCLSSSTNSQRNLTPSPEIPRNDVHRPVDVDAARLEPVGGSLSARSKASAPAVNRGPVASCQCVREGWCVANDRFRTAESGLSGTFRADVPQPPIGGRVVTLRQTCWANGADRGVFAERVGQDVGEAARVGPPLGDEINDDCA